MSFAQREQQCHGKVKNKPVWCLGSKIVKVQNGQSPAHAGGGNQHMRRLVQAVTAINEISQQAQY